GKQRSSKYSLKRLSYLTRGMTVPLFTVYRSGQSTQGRLFCRSTWWHFSPIRLSPFPRTIFEVEKPNTSQHISFSPNTCGLSEYDNMHSLANEFLNNSMKQETRKYRLTKKPKVPHYWRTRKDPFIEVWDEICSWLEEHPERTSKSLFDDLQQRYPDQFKDSQLRTLQRRVKEWRSKALFTFNYKWLKDELLVDDDFTTELQGKITHEAVF
ncbi:hypothetical protein KJ656_10240, partial [bacterium]|nr:hypothetical protein [bacterium]